MVMCDVQDCFVNDDFQEFDFCVSGFEEVLFGLNCWLLVECQVDGSLFQGICNILGFFKDELFVDDWDDDFWGFFSCLGDCGCGLSWCDFVFWDDDIYC